MKAHANYDQRTAKTETRRSSQTFAREVTKKTVDRIKKRVKRKEWEKTIEETEEKNRHKIDNTGENDTDHIIGIYRWLDKFYDVQVFNHGKRMLLEFVVPEPGAFYRYSQATDAAEEVDMEKPTPPKINKRLLELMDSSSPDLAEDQVERLTKGANLRSLRPGDLRAWNYKYYLQKYGAKGSPPDRQLVTKNKTKTATAKKRSVIQQQATISVPEGYVATRVGVEDPIYSRPDPGEEPDGSNIHGLSVNIVGHNWKEGYLHGTDHGDLGTKSEGRKLVRVDGQSPWSKNVPVSIYAEDSKGFSLQFHVLCERTPENFEQWKIDTYRSIMEAYRNERAEYEERVAAQEIQGGPDITGQNPGRNREIEQTELKRLVMAMLKGDALHPSDIEAETGPSTSPTDVTETGIENRANTIRFLEQAFEWTNMTYKFYPYYWADEAKWASLSRLESSDPTFASFLRAGAARVVVPVRPGYEYQVPYFMQYEEPYFGDGPPSIGDPGYVSIIDAIKDQQNKLPEEAKTVGDPWKVKVPTSLIKLQQGGSLSGDGPDNGGGNNP
nr:hypothetical protein DEQ67_15385 [Haloferax sp. Atlit-48N]